MLLEIEQDFTRISSRGWRSTIELGVTRWEARVELQSPGTKTDACCL
jgi:hypothetical protein